MLLQGKKIIICITGSIAAYKIPLLIRLLKKEGAEVQIIVTPAAKDFVTPLTLSTLSQNPVLCDAFSLADGKWNSHIELGRWADLMLFAPLSANTLAKMANGIADNLLLTTYLAARCPIFFAPAMDMDMYQHPATQKNVKILQSFGNTLIAPREGELASGLCGAGRMEEPETIVEIFKQYFHAQQDFLGKKVLISAGPTYENIDPVRFIGNYATGTMGYALANEFNKRGASVTLVSGPTHLTSEDVNINVVHVTSAEEMKNACLLHAKDADIIIMAAAVADFTPVTPHSTKIKKSDHIDLTLRLQPTTDILAALSKQKHKNQYIAGFALETDNEIENAKKKLADKNLDLIILNSLKEPGAGFGYSTNKITTLDKKGNIVSYDVKMKQEVAKDIADTIQKQAAKPAR
ncbi:MAG: bifunctional phosphopantothenoylcysteine decarboxylase/phosphopantothenate--cysteine ligase CoaBC [Lentimicrobiaceae bacterium]|nr:bifunctional phosphopantothenoylcysteine decarboxylase/phosphopantothenate--cysteine ligase CoaBC [Lentimicrobiaceae bacterium]